MNKNAVKEAQKTLKKLEKELKKESPSKPKILDLSTTFYSLIPHKIEQDAKLPAIDNVDLVNKKFELLEEILQFH